MTESDNTKKKKYGKIVNSAFSAFLIPFIGGAALSFGAEVSSFSMMLGLVSMGTASGLFIWGIVRSAQDSINIENRIDKLESRIKELEKRK